MPIVGFLRPRFVIHNGKKANFISLCAGIGDVK